MTSVKLLGAGAAKQLFPKPAESGKRKHETDRSPQVIQHILLAMHCIPRVGMHSPQRLPLEVLRRACYPEFNLSLPETDLCKVTLCPHKGVTVWCQVVETVL